MTAFLALASLVIVLLSADLASATITASAQVCGAGGTDAATVDCAMPGSVTSGNIIVIAAVDNQQVPSASGVTQTAGTATLGTITRDITQTGTSPTQPFHAIYHVSVTGSGTLTLRFTPTPTTPSFIGIGAQEFAGMAASPFGISDANTGTISGCPGACTNETTNSIANTSGSVLFFIASEVSTSNQARTHSDVLIVQDNTGATQMTFIIQYKITTGTPNTLTDGWPENVGWHTLTGEYKASGAAPGVSSPILRTLTGVGL